METPTIVLPGDRRYAPHHTVCHAVRLAEHVEGWAFGAVLEDGSPLYAADERKHVERWMRKRVEWLNSGREFGFKSRWLDLVPGQLWGYGTSCVDGWEPVRVSDPVQTQEETA